MRSYALASFITTWREATGISSPSTRMKISPRSENDDHIDLYYDDFINMIGHLLSEEEEPSDE